MGAAPVSRVAWIAGYLWIALLVVVGVCAAAIVGSAIGAWSSGDAQLLSDAAIAGAGQALAAAAFIAVTGVIWAVAPRWTIPLSWSLVLIALSIGLFGPLFGLSEGVTRISPFASAPSPATDGVDIRGLWWLVAAIVVGGLLTLGLVRRRELAVGGE